MQTILGQPAPACEICGLPMGGRPKHKRDRWLMCDDCYREFTAQGFILRSENDQGICEVLWLNASGHINTKLMSVDTFVSGSVGLQRGPLLDYD